MPKWTKEQLEAIEKSGTNIIVSAGAGSGKTAVLTERVIEKLKSGIKINELLILTFTNAAAGEMKERIRKKINEHDELLDNLDYLDASYITTFDSYTLSLVKKYNYILNVSPNLSIIDSGVINIKKKEFLDKIFDDLYTEKNHKFLKLINDFCIKNDTSLKQAILKIYNGLELKIDREKYLKNYILDNFNENKIDKYINDFFNLIKEEFINIEDNLMFLEECDYYDFYYEMVKSLENLLKSKDYDEVFDRINVTLPRRPRGSDEIKIYKDNIDSSLKNIKSYLRFENVMEIKESFNIMKDYIEVIVDIVNKLYDMVMNYKKEYDLYEFTDIELMAIKLLKDNENICNEIKYFYKEICVDEYQDTNDIQEEFIKLIENNNVYMVGDIKQSIYGFRNANPTIFKNKYDNYSKNYGGIKIDLLKNFRSRSNVLNGINDIFSLIMDDTLGGADYVKSHQMVFGNLNYEDNVNKYQNYNLEIYNYKYDDKNYTKEEIESFIIGRDILDKIKNEYEVIDKETGKLRNCRYEDFCIIMDRGTSFPLVNKVLEYLGIPTLIYEDKKLTNEIDLYLINNILGFILKIKDNILDTEFKYYFMSIARSYLFEYPDDCIFKIIKDNNYKNTDIYKLCKDISLKIDILDNYEVVKEIINKFNFYENIIKVGNIEESIIRINSIYDIAKNISNMGYTPYMFKDYLQEMLNSKNEIKYKAKSSASNSVKIMNIHKSKGLEFPICYFCGYHKEFNTMDIKDRFIYDKDFGIITPYFMEGIGTTILKDLLKDKYFKDNISEQIRLFYVALTRAKEKMIIVTNLSEEENYSKNLVPYNIRRKYNSFLSMLNSININLKQYIKNIDVNSLNINKDYLISAGKILEDTVIDSDIINYNEITFANEVIEESHASKEINNIISKEEQQLLEYGTKMHEILEYADFVNLENNKECKNIIENFVNTLNIKKDTLIYKEHEFIYEIDNVSYHGIIDLVLIDKDIIKIVDYKLKNIDDPKYVEQLNIYYKYLNSMYNKKIEMYLYSIVDNQLKEIK